MEKTTHVELFSCFAAGWSLFMLTEMARMGTEAKPDCDHYDDKAFKGPLSDVGDALEARCNGIGAGAGFSAIALLFAVASLVLRNDERKRAGAFLASVVFWLIALTCFAGGESSYSCELDKDSPNCQGYGAAATFYMFAAIAAAGALVVKFKSPENHILFYAVAAVMLGLFSLAELSVYARGADKGCGDGDDDDKDAAEARCSGNAFAALITSFSMAMMFAFAAFVHVKGDGSKATVVWYLWAAVFLLARVASIGAESKVNCDAKGKAADNACNGYGFSAFFYMMGCLAAVAGVYVSLKSMEKVGNLIFYLTFALFYLAYTCTMGARSAFACESDANGSDYAKDRFDSECDGYGFSSFSSIMACLALTGAAVLSQTSRVERNDDAGAAAPADEMSVPPAEAYVQEDNGKGAERQEQEQQKQEGEGANV